MKKSYNLLVDIGGINLHFELDYDQARQIYERCKLTQCGPKTTTEVFTHDQHRIDNVTCAYISEWGTKI